MSIITLTTDLGFKDPMIPAVKGFLLTKIPNVQLIDLSHEISPFHYVEAAFFLQNSMPSFPEGTIHLVGIEGDFNPNSGFIAAELEGQIILTKNNGLVSLIAGQNPINNQVLLPILDAAHLIAPLRFILAPNAVKLAENISLTELGEAIEGIGRSFREPVLQKDNLVGSIIHFTNYGNAITNIKRSHLDRYTNFKNFKIHFARNAHLETISNSYYDVLEGETCCFFGMQDLLEIGIHGGGARELFGLSKERNIWIEFYNI